MEFVRHCVVVSVVAAVCAAGCSAESPSSESLTAASSAIQGGTNDTTHLFAVGVVAQLAGGTGLCSGALLAPNLVATARHCVAPPAGTTVYCASATFGSEVDPSKVFVIDAPSFDQTNPDPGQLVVVLGPAAIAIHGDEPLADLGRFVVSCVIDEHITPATKEVTDELEAPSSESMIAPQSVTRRRFELVSDPCGSLSPE